MPMISVEEAEKRLFAQPISWGSSSRRLDQITPGVQVLAEDVVADRNLPPFARCCMDGYVVDTLSYQARRDDLLAVAGDQPAGSTEWSTLPSGAALRISTGAIVPEPDKALIFPRELVQVENRDQVRLPPEAPPERYIHAEGSDARQGDVLVSRGTPVNPAVRAIAASVGRGELAISNPPRIGILLTGEEIVPIEQTPQPAQIRASNDTFLRATLEVFGGRIEVVRAVDDPAILNRQLGPWLDKFDLIVTTGGVSGGPHDHLPRIWEELEVTPWFHRVAQKPGKPLWVGRAKQGTMIFSFPGNPASTALCSARYLVPWIRRGLGLTDPSRFRILSSPLSNPLPLTRFWPVGENADGTVAPLHLNTSGDFIRLATAIGWVEMPPQNDSPAGGRVRFFPV